MVDWIYWTNLAVVSYMDACSLSLGLEPRGDAKGNLKQDVEAEFRRRVEIAKSHLHGDLPAHPTDADRYHDCRASGVRLVEFREWGESLPEPFSFPEQFPGTPRGARHRAAPSSDEIARVARMDLWSQAELSGLCVGLFPDAMNRSDEEVIATNKANEAIARGTLSGRLTFIPRNDADSAAVMYGTARHYVPAVAAEWAASRFDTFPKDLLAAVRGHAPAVVAGARWPWGEHETDLLRKLAAAANRFWKLYDPSDASTAPTNDAVAEWLKEQNVADRNAQVMATILRADGLPTGPRK